MDIFAILATQKMPVLYAGRHTPDLVGTLVVSTLPGALVPKSGFNTRRHLN